MTPGIKPIQPNITRPIQSNTSSGGGEELNKEPERLDKLYPSSPALRKLPPMSSSPLPPLAGSSQSQAESLRAQIGGKIKRPDLAVMMGVGPMDKSRKQYLRGKVREQVLKFLDMKRSFKQYDYTTEMYPVIKYVTTFMNREYLAGAQKWSRETTHHVIHSIIEDTRRNEGSKEKSAEKRKAKRLLAVSAGTSVPSMHMQGPTSFRLT